MDFARLDAIADVGTQFTDQQATLKMFHNIPTTPFERWVFNLGTRETLHMIENSPKC